MRRLIQKKVDDEVDGHLVNDSSLVVSNFEELTVQRSSEKLSARVSRQVSAKVSARVSAQVSPKASLQVSAVVSGHVSARVSGHVSARATSPRKSLVGSLTEEISEATCESQIRFRRNLKAHNSAHIREISQLGQAKFLEIVEALLKEQMATSITKIIKNKISFKNVSKFIRDKADPDVDRSLGLPVLDWTRRRRKVSSNADAAENSNGTQNPGLDNSSEENEIDSKRDSPQKEVFRRNKIVLGNIIEEGPVEDHDRHKKPYLVKKGSFEYKFADHKFSNSRKSKGDLLTSSMIYEASFKTAEQSHIDTLWSPEGQHNLERNGLLTNRQPLTPVWLTSPKSTKHSSSFLNTEYKVRASNLMHLVVAIMIRTTRASFYKIYYNALRLQDSVKEKLDLIIGPKTPGRPMKGVGDKFDSKLERLEFRRTSTKDIDKPQTQITQTKTTTFNPTDPSENKNLESKKIVTAARILFQAQSRYNSIRSRTLNLLVKNAKSANEYSQRREKLKRILAHVVQARHLRETREAFFNFTIGCKQMIKARQAAEGRLERFQLASEYLTSAIGRVTYLQLFAGFRLIESQKRVCELKASEKLTSMARSIAERQRRLVVGSIYKLADHIRRGAEMKMLHQKRQQAIIHKVCRTCQSKSRMVLSSLGVWNQFSQIKDQEAQAIKINKVRVLRRLVDNVKNLQASSLNRLITFIAETTKSTNAQHHRRTVRSIIVSKLSQTCSFKKSLAYFQLSVNCLMISHENASTALAHRGRRMVAARLMSTLREFLDSAFTKLAAMSLERRREAYTLMAFRAIVRTQLGKLVWCMTRLRQWKNIVGEERNAMRATRRMRVYALQQLGIAHRFKQAIAMAKLAQFTMRMLPSRLKPLADRLIASLRSKSAFCLSLLRLQVAHASKHAARNRYVARLVKQARSSECRQAFFVLARHRRGGMLRDHRLERTRIIINRAVLWTLATALSMIMSRARRSAEHELHGEHRIDRCVRKLVQAFIIKHRGAMSTLTMHCARCRIVDCEFDTDKRRKGGAIVGLCNSMASKIRRCFGRLQASTHISILVDSNRLIGTRQFILLLILSQQTIQRKALAVLAKTASKRSILLASLANLARVCSRVKQSHAVRMFSSLTNYSNRVGKLLRLQSTLTNIESKSSIVKAFKAIERFAVAKRLCLASLLYVVESYYRRLVQPFFIAMVKLAELGRARKTTKKLLLLHSFARAQYAKQAQTLARLTAVSTHNLFEQEKAKNQLSAIRGLKTNAIAQLFSKMKGKSATSVLRMSRFVNLELKHDLYAKNMQVLRTSLLAKKRFAFVKLIEFEVSKKIENKQTSPMSSFEALPVLEPIHIQLLIDQFTYNITSDSPCTPVPNIKPLRRTKGGNMIKPSHNKNYSGSIPMSDRPKEQMSSPALHFDRQRQSLDKSSKNLSLSKKASESKDSLDDGRLETNRQTHMVTDRSLLASLNDRRFLTELSHHPVEYLDFGSKEDVKRLLMSQQIKEATLLLTLVIARRVNQHSRRQLVRDAFTSIKTYNWNKYYVLLLLNRLVGTDANVAFNSIQLYSQLAYRRRMANIKLRLMTLQVKVKDTIVAFERVRADQKPLIDNSYSVFRSAGMFGSIENMIAIVERRGEIVLVKHAFAKLAFREFTH